VIITNFVVFSFFLAYSLSVESDLYEKLEDHQTYFSSVVMEIFSFSMWALVAGIAFVVGLEYTILIPVGLGGVWLIYRILAPAGQKSFSQASVYAKN